MMNTQEIQKLHTAIVECIDQQRLNQAMSLLAKLTDETGSAQLRDQLEQVKMSYNFMLQYMSQGVLDPKRDEVLGHIVSTLWTLTDQCVIMLREKDSPEVFFARRRELADVALSDLMTQYRTLLNKSRLLLTVDEDKRDRAALLEVLRSREQCETTIFNKIWSAFPTTKGEAEIIGQFITDEDIPEPARCLAVMALLLGLTKYYDETKLSLLADAYSTSNSAEVQVRAIIAVLLALNGHRNRVKHSRSLQSHIDAMTETPNFADDVAMVLYRLIGTRNTDRVTKRVTQDIIPDIMRASPELMRKIRDRNSDIDPEDLEGNPEWQDMLENSGLSKKMEEFTQLQQEGSDVFISTFSRLKSFPFFNTLSNWFLPYHNEHSVVKESFGDDERMLRDVVSQAPYLCNSDRYSLCLSLRSVPESQRRLMMSQTQQQMDELKELQQDLPDVEHTVKRDMVANRCVQDLYRFFKLFSRRREFMAVINTQMDFTALPYLAKYTDRSDTLQVIAEFYLKNEFDEDAVRYFNMLLEQHEETNPIVLQKLGFAHERLGNTREALKQYKRYELANDEDLWTLKHIASCYRTLKKPDKAIEYYERIEQLKPGQVSNTLNMGHALLENGRTEEALQHYFKADLMDENRHRGWRPIAWCSFLLGNDERALDYYNRIIENGNATMSDYLNRGHVHLCAHRISDAITDYRQALQLCNNDKQKFYQSITADMAHLQARGLSASDVLLVVDATTN